MARKHNVGEFRETKKVKDPSRLKRVGASAKQREAFLELKALDRSNKAEQGKLLFKFTFNEEKYYEKATNTHYRARSSGYVREYNETYSDQLPMGLEFSFKTFRCVYSVYQEYRAKGDRSNNTGYTGCKARFTARFVNIASSEEEIFPWMEKQLGRQFTPQQTKNLLKRIGSNMSSHSRCFLTHSHRWKTLAMDWTHSTNNLGFHLVFVYDNRSHLLPTRIVAFEVLEDDLQCFGFFVHSHEVKYCSTPSRFEKKTTRQAPFSTQSFGERSSAEVFCRHALQFYCCSF
ncbi:hypothetical protein PC120_g8817 [Phytophthora cactorum]|nr:hypothetical protein PC120_g8817 [Phytophthora cactorum]